MVSKTTDEHQLAESERKQIDLFLQAVLDSLAGSPATTQAVKCTAFIWRRPVLREESPSENRLTYSSTGKGGCVEVCLVYHLLMGEDRGKIGREVSVEVINDNCDDGDRPIMRELRYEGTKVVANNPL